MKRFTLAFLTIFALGAQEKAPPLIADYIRANVGAVPAELKRDPFYTKHADALGLSIDSSEKVPDAALLVARDIVTQMLAKRPDLREAMIAGGYRVAVMAQSESTTDLPEQRDWKKPAPDDRRLTTGEKQNYERLIGSLTDKQYWDRRARGMGGRMTSCAEENLLGYPGTRYFGENIFVHEFSHGIMSVIRTADPQLVRRHPGSVQAGHGQGHVEEPVRQHQFQRVLGGGHADLVLVQHFIPAGRQMDREPR